MLISRILFPITSLGPGNRLVIWTQGCSNHCPNCASPELQPFDQSKCIAPKKLFDLIKANVNSQLVDGITITGGEPLQQPMDELLELLTMLNTITPDIIIYTGYPYKDLRSILGEDAFKSLCSNINVMIAGPYIDKLNDSSLTLKGSSNQTIHLFKMKYKDLYAEYIKRGRTIQNVYNGREIISVGIHSKEAQANE